MFTSADAVRLFAERSILMGDEDVITISAVLEIGGRAGELAHKAMAKTLDYKRHLVIFGDVDSGFNPGSDCYAVCYTFEGFRHFLSYLNIIELKHLLDNPPVKKGNVIDIRAALPYVKAKVPNEGAKRK